MKNNDKLQKEPGSMQRQTQKDAFGIMPIAKKDKSKDQPVSKPHPNEIDDEKIIPGLAKKYNTPWNSIDFEKDDFLGSLAHS